jgi:hypothetical protein
MENFFDSTPSIPPTDAEFEFGRYTQTQPYCDWTLELEAVTIIGIYSNVVPGGHFEPSQILDEAFDVAKRTSDLVLSGHVHDYQRFTRKRGKEKIPYIVIGTPATTTCTCSRKAPKRARRLAAASPSRPAWPMNTAFSS